MMTVNELIDIIFEIIINNFFERKKNVKITKRPHAFKVYASSYYNVDILNSFNPELQLKNTESATKNKLIELLS